MTTEMMKKTGREIAAEIVGSALIALSTYNVALYAEFPMRSEEHTSELQSPS